MSHDLSYYAEAARNYSPLLTELQPLASRLPPPTANRAGGTQAAKGAVHPFTAGAERGLPVRTRPDQRRRDDFFPMERTGCHGLLRLRLGRE